MVTSQGRQYQRRQQTTYENSQYVYGNTVRQPQRAPQRTQAPRKVERPQSRPITTTRKNSKVSFPFFMFLVCAVVFCGFVLGSQVSVKSELTATNEEITRLESQLNNIRLENDEDYSRIKNGIDLDEIRMKAIGKLGMTYATEGQIIYYSELDDDYVRQVSDIPTK